MRNEGNDINRHESKKVRVQINEERVTTRVRGGGGLRNPTDHV